MRPEDYEYLYAIEERFWWFVAMRRITDTILRNELGCGGLRILDAGCGTGYNLRHYADAGHSVFGFDLAQAAIDAARKRGFSTIARASVTDIPYASDTFDLVLSFEVIDELPGAVYDRAIQEFHRVLRPGGVVFVRVPAFEWLRSSHDADIGTAHRFTLHELRQKMTRAGFEVGTATYANTFLFPVVALRRFLKRLGIGSGTDTKPLPPGLQWLDPILRTVLETEASVIRLKRSLPFGLSAICCARKPPSAGNFG